MSQLEGRETLTENYESQAAPDEESRQAAEDAFFAEAENGAREAPLWHDGK